MSDLLAEIIAHKTQEVAQLKQVTSQADLIAKCSELPPCRGFVKALDNARRPDRLAIIAEAKCASPSAGALVANYDPVAIARGYAAAGATCLSVLTDHKYFGGEAQHLTQVQQSCPLPVLRKDFIVDAWQVYETRAMGADCLLLICAAMTASKLAELTALGHELGLDVLVEVHAASEVEAALASGSKLLGINNRNLATLATDLATTETLAPMLRRPDKLLVSESAIKSRDDAARVAATGVAAILVGESLLRASEPQELLAQLRLETLN